MSGFDRLDYTKSLSFLVKAKTDWTVLCTVKHSFMD